MCNVVNLIWKLKRFVYRWKGSGPRARERLEVIVMCDRINLDRSALDALKAELTGVVARYTEVDRDAAKLEVARDRSGVRLVAVFPVKKIKRSVGCAGGTQ